MAKHVKTEKVFLLKDALFNERKVRQLAGELKATYPDFREKECIKKILTEFPEQELMERIHAIKDALHQYLPQEYPQALALILKALPPALDDRKVDDDFGDFIYAPYSYFVATYGCTKEYLEISLKALPELTQRFSAEAALRNFLNAFPRETLAAVKKWATSKNYHVRRLASEGTRPNLPWAKKILVPKERMLEILDTLHADSTRYVTRSVANHLNDISKTDPLLVVATLKRWQREEKQNIAELKFITKHALRTSVKKGHPEALALLGFTTPQVTVTELKLKQKTVTVGESLEFSFELSSLQNTSQDLLIKYLIYFKKANGKLSPKVFTLATKTVYGREVVTFSKSHALRPMTTRTLYSGEHAIEIQINGQRFGKVKFEIQ